MIPIPPLTLLAAPVNFVGAEVAAPWAVEVAFWITMLTLGLPVPNGLPEEEPVG
jgi:hypothetical protein